MAGMEPTQRQQDGTEKNSQADGGQVPGQKQTKPQIAVDQMRSLMEQIDSVLVDLPTESQQADLHLQQWLEMSLGSDDLHVDELPGQPGHLPLKAIYFIPMVSEARLIQDVYQPLSQAKAVGAKGSQGGPNQLLDRRQWLEHGRWSQDPHIIQEELLNGSVALLAQGQKDVYLIKAKAEPHRNVDEPSTEVALLAPKEAFVESLETNLALVRQRLNTHQIRVKFDQVGRLSKTKIAVLYIDGLADPTHVKKVRQGVQRIETDYLQSANSVLEVLFADSLTPFPLGQRTERPDRTAQGLTEGRIVVMVDGSPFVLIVPTTMPDLQRDSEMYVSGPIGSTYVRYLRVFGLLIGVLSPAIYVILLGISPELAPPDVLVNIAASRSGVPYSVMFEMLIFLIVVDVVIEATQQAPSPVGQTLTIVGSLIIGEAAVQAKLASQLLVVVLAITTIGSLLAVTLPFAYAVRIAKYPLTIFAGTLGIYGLTVAILLLTTHLAALKSLDTPYLSAVAPLRWREFITYHLFSLSKPEQKIRPATFRPQDMVRARPHGKVPPGLPPTTRDGDPQA